VHEPGVGPDEFSEVGEEGDDVVLGRLFDLVDPRDVELGLGFEAGCVAEGSSSRRAKRRGDPGVVGRPTLPWIASP
jgi:hypothetical protein